MILVGLVKVPIRRDVIQFEDNNYLQIDCIYENIFNYYVYSHRYGSPMYLDFLSAAQDINGLW